MQHRQHLHLSHFLLLTALMLMGMLATGTDAAAPTRSRLQMAAAEPLLETILTVTNGAAGDNFGHSAALDGNTLVVGAYWVTVAGKEKAGAAYVYTRPSATSTQWTPLTRLEADDGAAFDQFGSAVAVDGDTIVVSALLADVAGSTNQGAAYVFGRNQGGPNAWGQVKKLISSNGNSFDEFGNSLLVDGDEILVAAQAADVDGSTRRGAVYVFRRNEGGTANWGEAGILSDPNGRESDNFGSEIALDGNWLVVGADRTDVTGTYENDGAAMLFQRNAPGSEWSLVKRLTASDAAGSEQFGSSVAIRGERVLVGAPAAEGANGFSVGKAYLFERNQNGVDNWGEVKLLTADNGQAFDVFGQTVALGDNIAYVGAGSADVAIADEGAVYLFEKDRNGANFWGQAQKLGASNGTPNARFGTALQRSGDTLVVGSPLGGGTKGTVYLYTPAPPTQTFTSLLPMIFTPTFRPSAVLKDGGVVTSAEGVKLGAVPGALTSDLAVSIYKSAAEAPVPSRATVVGDYFHVSAAQDTVQPMEKAFILGLPIPPGVDTDHLAAAVYASTDGLLDMDNPSGHFWSFGPGVYDRVNDLLLVQLPYLAYAGETIVLVDHPDLLSPVQASNLAAENVSAVGEAASANFLVACTEALTCSDALKKEVEDELQKQFSEFLNVHGYRYPRLTSLDTELSIDPPRNSGLPGSRYFAFIFNRSQAGCTDQGGKPAYAGQYAPAQGFLHICADPGTTALSDFQRDTLRHEYFHALEFGYDNVLVDWRDDRSEDWIIEGMAEAVINSAADWKRSGANAIRPVDKTLRDDSDGLAYQTEDFWVYVGKNRVPGGIERLKQILFAGATFDDVFANIDFDDAYWLWVRNQVLEKSDDLDGALGPKCKLEEGAVSDLRVWDIQLPTILPEYIGSTETLNSTVVELDFSDDWAGLQTRISVTALPAGQTQPPFMEYKVYRTPWPNCSSTPDNAEQLYEVVPGERYFVVISNWYTEAPIAWSITIE